ncbi:unnamed protein product [Rodentolepis nana]|uniref:GAR domain-containing protein n=1 Tax=Rodentolepis nana TaxID=102285 RepID=A0A158QIG0_RODNA|nr:unnamed protein product [Rodentolepis nana]
MTIGVLDESMCVIREDICDWLQRYVFSDADVLPLIDPADLLERLKSGIWLARLAYKLHFKVLAENLPQCSRGVKVTSKEHKLYASLRGTGPSSALGQLTSKNLPEFSTALIRAARSCLSESDTATGGFAPPPTIQTPSPANSTVPSESGVVLRNRWTARGNISEFLKWCHDLGISETVLFETNGLVFRTEEKNVLLTLMDLARLASRFGLCELPELVRMEKEIEALEAAAAASNANATTRNPTATGSMTSYNPKVDIGVYVARLADRKASDCSPERSSVSSDVDVPSTSSSIGSGVSSDPVVRYCSSATFTTTRVILTDLEDEGKSSEARNKIDSSTDVNTSDSAADAFCQTLTNNPEMISSCTNAENNRDNSSSTSVETDKNANVTDDSVMASLPPRKIQHVSTSNIKPRAAASKLPVHQSRVSGNKSASNGITKVEVAKRSTSAADLRELSKSRVKRRNIRQDKGDLVSNEEHSLKNQDVSVSIKAKITTDQNTQISSMQLRSPLADHNQMTQIPKPLSTSSTSSKHSSSGFVSHASSCSDLAAEVRKQTAQCTCCSRNRLVRLDEGRYQMGNRIYYLRRFRSHVMVRVGGGWLTLAQFLDRYDPCRQKDGEFHTLASSHSNLTGNIIDRGNVVRISASKILKEWPSTDLAVKENCCR